MSTQRKSPSEAAGAGAGNGPGPAVSYPNDTTSPASLQPLALYHVARRRAGASDYDAPLILTTWPDVPTNDEGGIDPAELAAWLLGQPAELQNAVNDVDIEAPPPDPDNAPLSLLTADDILTGDWPDPVWAVPGLLPAGLTILAGRPKVGKSWLALQVAQAVASGGVALGERVDAGPILYLALEDPPRRLQERMKAQGWIRGLPAEFMPLGEFTQQIDDLRNGGGERLALQIQIKGYRLVIIDTLSRSCYGDQSDMQAMTLALTPIQEMAHAHNCAVLMVDHHRKGFGADPDAVGDILGSTAKGALADCIWGLYRERGKTGAKLAVTGRDVQERALALKMDGLTSVWQVEGDADELEMTERRQEIIDALATLQRAQVGAIATAIGQDKGNTYRRLQDMVNADKVKRWDDGGKVFYALPELALPI